jgi:hypothetical protein
MGGIATRINSVDEFLAELGKDAAKGLIERNIVRCGRRTPSGPAGVVSVFTTATYIVRVLPDGPDGAIIPWADAPPRIVRLDYFAGYYWGGEMKGDEATTERSESVAREIELKCSLLDLELRGGAFVPEEDL